MIDVNRHTLTLNDISLNVNEIKDEQKGLRSNANLISQTKETQIYVH